MKNHYRWTSAFLFLLACGQANSADSDHPTRQESQQLANRCRKILRTSLIDFYLPACVDQKHGGYLEAFQDGRFVATGEKFLTMQARQLWFFSTLVRADLEKEHSLQAARSGFRFLEDHLRDPEYGGYFSTVSDAGEPRDRRKHVYLNSFALFGLAAYYRATNDESALKAAQDLFRVLEEQAHDQTYGGYVEFFAEDWEPLTDPQVAGYVGVTGTKTYNTHLHVMEALTELHRVWPDRLVKQRLSELVQIMTTTVHHPQFACNLDGWRANWQSIETPANLRASYGHDVECVWLTFDAGRELGLPPDLLKSWAKSLWSYTFQHGYDREHGGLYYTGPVGQAAEDRRKEWWVQAEALVSLLEMYRLTGEPQYWQAFYETLTFVEQHHVATDGGWWATRAADGSPQSESRSSKWQGAYHSGRSMLWCAQLLEENNR